MMMSTIDVMYIGGQAAYFKFLADRDILFDYLYAV